MYIVDQRRTSAKTSPRSRCALALKNDATVCIFGGLYETISAAICNMLIRCISAESAQKTSLRSRCAAALKNGAAECIFGGLYGGCVVAVLTGAVVTILFILRGSHHTAPPSAAGSTCMRAASSCTRRHISQFAVAKQCSVY